MSLPGFSVDDYRRLLDVFVGAQFALVPAGQLRKHLADRVLYLRHDVDFDPCSMSSIAEAEAELGVKATYYVLLTQHYNPRHPDNQSAIRHVVDLGHEIGLHYDMETYPSDPAAARQHLNWEAALLADVAGAPVTSISMHQPSMGSGDPFEELDEFVHAHDPRVRPDVYVSDSCRAWRDETLLTCIRDAGPRRVLLNTHPELWLDGSIRDRVAYLERLRDRVSSRYRLYMDTAVRHSWLSHEGGRLHDERESLSC